MAVNLSNGDVTATGRVTGAKVKVPTAADLEVGESATLSTLLAAAVGTHNSANDAHSALFGAKVSTSSVSDSFPETKPSAGAGTIGTIRAVWEWVTSKLSGKANASDVLSLSGGTMSGDILDTGYSHKHQAREFELASGSVVQRSGRISIETKGDNEIDFGKTDDGTPRSKLIPDGSAVATMMKTIPSGAEDYDQNKPYVVGDTCWYGYALWMNKEACTGIQPSTQSIYWEKLEKLSTLFSGANTSYNGNVIKIENGSQTTIKGYVDGLVGDIQTALVAINGEAS